MKEKRLSALQAWMAVVLSTAVLGVIDWKTGYELNFFAFYFLPVGIAGWYLGLGPAVIVAIADSIVWFAANSHQPYSSHLYATWNTIIRLVSFIALGWTIAKLSNSLKREKEMSNMLRKSLSEIKVLEGFLPVCAECKKIRNQQGVWQHMEVYIGEHSNTQFSHGYCPDCARKAMEEAGLLDVEKK